MRTLKDYIQESRQVDIINITDKNGKLITPVKYAFDSESFDEFIKYYEKNEKYFIDKSLTLCEQKNNKWITLPGEGIIHDLHVNDDYYVQDKLQFTMDELKQKLDDGEYILLLIKGDNK